MHEMALCEQVMRIVDREAQRHHFQRVNTIRLQIGARSCVTPHAMDFCFEVLSRGTMAEGAKLQFLWEPTTAWCLTCSETVTLEDRFDPCPRCGSDMVQQTGSDDLRVQDLEVV